MVPEAVRDWCRGNGWGEIIAARPVGGGCINHGLRLETEKGSGLFLKTNPAAPPDMFEREAKGLSALRTQDGPRLPIPYLSGPDFLLLEDLAPAPRRADYWTGFGHRLAALHNHVGSRFGFAHDNYIGSTHQPNGWMEDGYEFFGEQRLLYQALMAHHRRLLSAESVRRIEHLAARLPILVPPQPASLIHGDLWSGNAITDSQGSPALIDPAAHFGWAEAELAMTALFGGFPEAFYQAYLEARLLDPGWQSRFPIYNLYHLLNHLNLFGSGYLRQVEEILDRYHEYGK